MPIHPQRQRWKTRKMTNPLANILVERDCVAETGAAWIRRCGEKTIVRWMPAIHIRMRDTAEHSEIGPIFPQHFEIRRRRVVAPAVFREEMFRQQTKVVADSK